MRSIKHPTLVSVPRRLGIQTFSQSFDQRLAEQDRRHRRITKILEVSLTVIMTVIIMIALGVAIWG